MKRTRVWEYLILLAGLLVLTGGLAHARLGWPAVRAALEQAGAGADLMETMAIGWNFGGASMGAFGVLVLLGFAQLRRGRPEGRVPPIVVGLLYLLFGAGAYACTFPNPHFLVFMIVGALLLAASLAWRAPAAE